MPEPICVIYPTIMDGRVARWFASLDAYCDDAEELVSASRNAVRVRVDRDQLPDGVLAAAERAHEILARGGPEDEVYAMATHRPKRFMSRELEPVLATADEPEAVIDPGEGLLT